MKLITSWKLSKYLVRLKLNAGRRGISSEKDDSKDVSKQITARVSLASKRFIIMNDSQLWIIHSGIRVPKCRMARAIQMGMRISAGKCLVISRIACSLYSECNVYIVDRMASDECVIPIAFLSSPLAAHSSFWWCYPYIRELYTVFCTVWGIQGIVP